MKAMVMSFFSVLMVGAALLFTAEAGEIRDPGTDIAFPDAVSVKSNGNTYNMQATGVATRKKVFFKVYSIAHYIQDAASITGADKIQAVLDADKAKQFTIKWVRGVDAKTIAQSYREALQKSFSQADQEKLKSQIEGFLGFFSADSKKGDVYEIRSFPGGTVEVAINGKVAGSVTSKDFAKGVWLIWFGDHSVVDRNALVSLLK